MKSYDLITTAKIPMFAPKEIDELKRLARLLPTSPIVVIIGAGVGCASLAILEERKDALIFSVDIEFPTQEPMYQPGERANLIKAGYWDSGRIIQVWGDSATVGKHWPIAYDMLLIDGDHHYEAVVNDIKLWLPHAKPGATVSLHDYAPKTKRPGSDVKQVVDKMMKGKHKFISLVRWLISFEVDK